MLGATHVPYVDFMLVLMDTYAASFHYFNNKLLKKMLVVDLVSAFCTHFTRNIIRALFVVKFVLNLKTNVV